jgi:fibronectin-binding autotransporter adhesin
MLRLIDTRVLTASFFALILTTAPVFAQQVTYTWTGGNSNDLWSSPLNWTASLGDPPPVSDIANTLIVLAGTTQTTNTLDYTLSANSLTFASGAGSFAVGGTNTLTLGTGGISIASGNTNNQAFNAPLALGAAQSWVNNGSGLLTVGGNVSGSTNNLTISGSGNTTITGVVTTSGTFTKQGSSTLTLTANNSAALTGPISVTGGVLSIPTSTAIGTNVGTVTLDGGTLLNTNPGNAGSFIGANRTLVIGPNGGTVNYTSSDSGTVSVYGGTILGSGTLTKEGPHEFRYQGAGLPNTTFTKLVVNEGLFRLGFAASTADERGFGAVPASPLADAITLNGGAIGTSFGVTLHQNRGITLGPNNGFFNTSGGAMTVPGVISGVGSLNKNTTGTLTLSGANTYAGATNITGGTLTMGAANVLPSTTAVNVSGGTLNLAGFSQTIGSLAGTSNVTLGSNAVLTVGTNNTSTVHSGVISGTTSSLVKVGTGKQTLAGANTYAAGTTVSGGILAVNNTTGSGTGTGAVIVANGATLQGTGTIGGPVTAQPGATLKGGDVGIGTLTVNANLVAEASASAATRLIVEADSSNTSLIAVTGGSNRVNFVSPSGSQAYTIELVIPTLSFGTTYTRTIMTSEGGFLSNDLGPLPDGTTFTPNSDYVVVSPNFIAFSDLNLQITNGGTFLVLTFTPVPEPGTVLGLTAGVLGLGFAIRQRVCRRA